MAMKVAATYANGAFVPECEVNWFEGNKVWLAIDDRFAASLPANSPLAAAEREFALAFANGGWDEERIEAGCRMVWQVARTSVVGAAKARGYVHNTDNDLLNAMIRLGDMEIKAGLTNVNAHYLRFRAAEIFRDRGNLANNEVSPILLAEIWQFQDGLRAIQKMLDIFGEVGERVEMIA